MRESSSGLKETSFYLNFNLVYKDQGPRWPNQFFKILMSQCYQVGFFGSEEGIQITEYRN